MTLDLDRFVALRPRLYHLTERLNIERILSARTLHPASHLLSEARAVGWMRERRPESQRLAVRGEKVHVRDQQPLKEGNVKLVGGWSWGDLIEALSRRVFFWPGDGDGPVASGVNHFTRYRNDDCVVLVVETGRLFAANAGMEPEFCPYNSGSPRCNPKVGKAPRGPDTFVPAGRFERGAGGVVEVTFSGTVKLPESGWEVASHQRWVKEDR